MPESAKDICMREALAEYENLTGDKTGVEFQRPWLQDRSGTWAMGDNPNGFAGFIHSIKKTFRIMRGLQPERAAGAPNPVQVRYPDMTVSRPDGSRVVIDNKFTNARGDIDPWRTQIGTNGQTQRQDYDDINSRNTKGDKRAEGLSLDKDSCNCRGPAQPQEVPVMEEATGRVMVMLPSGRWVPAPGAMIGRLPSFGGLRMPGLRPVFPRFVIP